MLVRRPRRARAGRRVTPSAAPVVQLTARGAQESETGYSVSPLNSIFSSLAIFTVPLSPAGSEGPPPSAALSVSLGISSNDSGDCLAPVALNFTVYAETILSIGLISQITDPVTSSADFAAPQSAETIDGSRCRSQPSETWISVPSLTSWMNPSLAERPATEISPAAAPLLWQLSLLEARVHPVSFRPSVAVFVPVYSPWPCEALQLTLALPAVSSVTAVLVLVNLAAGPGPVTHS